MSRLSKILGVGALLLGGAGLVWAASTTASSGSAALPAGPEVPVVLDSAVVALLPEEVAEGSIFESFSAA